MTLIDGLVVIGGGLSAAAPLFMPRLVAEMNGTIETLDGRQIPRTELKAFNLEDESAFEAFARGEARQIAVPGSSRQVTYDPLKRIGVGLSRLGTSQAVAVGAYAFALHELDRQDRREGGNEKKMQHPSGQDLTQRCRGQRKGKKNEDADLQLIVH